jgi:hypothetical protein
MIGEDNLQEDGGEIIAVEEVIVHPDFQWTETVYGYDIALLKLKEPSTIAPIAFSTSDSDAPANASARVLGWGARDISQEGFGTDFPEQLHQLDVTIVSQGDCRTKWGEVGQILDSQICASSEGAINDFDEGGPLFVEGAQGPVLIGIPGFYFKLGDTEFPTLYTRISSFSDWIMEQMTTSLHFAQFGTGSGFSSDIVLVNTSVSQTLEGQVQFFDPDGAPLPLRLIDGTTVSEVEFDLASQQSTTIATDPEGDLVLGSAVASGEGEFGGVIRFTIPGSGIAGVGSAQPLTAAIVPARNQNGIQTALAIRNTGDQTITVKAYLLQDGSQVTDGSSEISIPGQGRIAQFIGEIFAAADTTDFVGEVRIETEDGAFAAIALELGGVTGEFTTLPVTPVEP